MNTTYAEVILPLPVEGAFTYAVPPELVESAKIGYRVVVPFGKKKFLTGIIRSLSGRAPEGFEIKEIAVVLDSEPIVRHPQMKLWEWIADYYMCPVGDVFKAAVPSGLKVESETFVELNPDYEPDFEHPLDTLEAAITQLLDHEGHMTVDNIARKLGHKRITSTVSAMIERGILIISEKIVERYRSVKEVYVKPSFTSETVNAAFEAVKGAKKQEQLLMALIEMTGANRKGTPLKEVTRKALIERAGVTTAILLAIIKKGIAETYVKEINRFKFEGKPSHQLPQLTPDQQTAYESIISQWHDRQTVLLHGVTSSGKTEIYAHLIDAALRRGDQVLYLVPEIALTTQLTRRLQKIFGNNIVVYHSKFSDNERVDIWRMMLSDPKPMVILGARSSVFLPFSRLGLVIVDEENESSYKQNDPAPRYNARDVALVLASMHGAKSLLGSATPAIETYYKAFNGKFGLVRLTKRYLDKPLPPVKFIDMKAAQKAGAVVGSISTEAIGRINTALNDGKQAILFRNRRGFAPMLRCKQCAWVPKCRHCDVSLTYHNYLRQMVCHYCGAAYPMPNLCPQCGQPSVEILGYGTERIEGEIEAAFAGRKVIRMDLDTTRNKDGYEHLIEQFSNHKADILVGTQMVTKGLDFKDVNTVVVVNADELINIPDFKSAERAFNMLEQVAGRAGRMSDGESQVLVQTYNPQHPLLEYLKAHDYEAFYNHEIREREAFAYPPFTHIIYIYLKHRDKQVLETFSMRYANTLANYLGNRVSGPDQPKVAKVKSLYIQKIMIKIENGASLPKLRAVLRDTYRQMSADPTLRNSTIYYDVDP